MAQWVRGWSVSFDMRVRILWRDKCFAVYGSSGKGGGTCLACRVTKFVNGAVG